MRFAADRASIDAVRVSSWCLSCKTCRAHRILRSSYGLCPTSYRSRGGVPENGICSWDSDPQDHHDVPFEYIDS